MNALAAFGLEPGDFAQQARPLGLWPENLVPVAVFASLSTQWRIGFAGPVGLDYGVLPVVFRLHNQPRADWPALFEDLRTLEAAALQTMRKKD